MNRLNVQRAKDIISQIEYATLATADRTGQPWNSPVNIACDDSYNFYWISPAAAQHTQNITENPRVFLVIYDSRASQGEREGVYIKALASTVEDKQEVAKALELQARRRKKSIEDMNLWYESSNLKIYKASPQQIWVNETRDLGHKFVDERVEIPLADLV